MQDFTLTDLKMRATNTNCPGCGEPVTGNYDIRKFGATVEKVHKPCNTDIRGGEIYKVD